MGERIPVFAAKDADPGRLSPAAGSPVHSRRVKWHADVAPMINGDEPPFTTDVLQMFEDDFSRCDIERLSSVAHQAGKVGCRMDADEVLSRSRARNSAAVVGPGARTGNG